MAICPCDDRPFPPVLDIPAGLDRLPRQIAGFPEFRLALLAGISAHARARCLARARRRRFRRDDAGMVGLRSRRPGILRRRDRERAVPAHRRPGRVAAPPHRPDRIRAEAAARRLGDARAVRRAGPADRGARRHRVPLRCLRRRAAADLRDRRRCHDRQEPERLDGPADPADDLRRRPAAPGPADGGGRRRPARPADLGQHQARRARARRCSRYGCWTARRT